MKILHYLDTGVKLEIPDDMATQSLLDDIKLQYNRIAVFAEPEVEKSEVEETNSIEKQTKDATEIEVDGNIVTGAVLNTNRRGRKRKRE